MKMHADKTPENKNLSVANELSQKQGGSESTVQFVDNRPESVAQRKLQEIANHSPQGKQAIQFQTMADNRILQQPLIQKKENNTGLPDTLKTGIENLSGYAMDDVKVHYSSDKPAQLQAHAYAQGTDIHLGPGQEKHLPHEAWHVVQQKQGRVRPTVQLKEKLTINDDEGLEKEADVMGAKALSGASLVKNSRNISNASTSSDTVQAYMNELLLDDIISADELKSQLETIIAAFNNEEKKHQPDYYGYITFLEEYRDKQVERLDALDKIITAAKLNPEIHEYNNIALEQLEANIIANRIDLSRKMFKQVSLPKILENANDIFNSKGGLSPILSIIQIYSTSAKTDALDLMELCSEKIASDLGRTDPRITVACMAHAGFRKKLDELAHRIWSSNLAGAFISNILQKVPIHELPEERLHEAQVIKTALPDTPDWNITQFTDLKFLHAVTSSEEPLGDILERFDSIVDKVRIHEERTHFFPPTDLPVAPIPTAGARPAVLNADTIGYDIPSTFPALEALIATMSPEEGDAYRKNYLIERGKSKKQFNKGDRVFVPVDNEPDEGGEINVKHLNYASYLPFHQLTIEPAPVLGSLDPEKTIPLFPKGGPSPEDVGQQALGDCYFLAALSSIAISDKAIITHVVKDYGGGNYAVRFFNKQVAKGKPTIFKPEWIVVNAEVYVDERGKPVYANNHKALWPGIVEKAYAVWKGRGAYENISGGFSNESFEHVLGKPSVKKSIEDLHTEEGILGSGKYSTAAIQLYKEIEQSIKTHRPVAFGTKEWGIGGSGQSAGENTTEVPGLASKHAYSIFGTQKKGGRLYLLVRNPWGHFGRDYKTTFMSKGLTPIETGEGIFLLELSDVMRYVANVHFV